MPRSHAGSSTNLGRALVALLVLGACTAQADDLRGLIDSYLNGTTPIGLPSAVPTPPPTPTPSPTPTPQTVTVPLKGRRAFQAALPPSDVTCNFTPSHIYVGSDTYYGVGGRVYTASGYGLHGTICLHTTSVPPSSILSARVTGPGIAWPTTAPTPGVTPTPTPLGTPFQDLPPADTATAAGACMVTPIGPYATANYVFTAHVQGLGGVVTCDATVTAVCGTSWLEGLFAVGYATFNWGGDTFIANNDPPICSWTWAGHGNRGSDPGCFAAETLLTLADGRQKRADRIEMGDLLWNPILREASRVKKVIVGPEQKPLVELAYGEARLLVTSLHPLPTKEGIRAAAKITGADELLGEDGRYHHPRVQRRASAIPPIVYNFELDTAEEAEDFHWLLADGFVVGDYFLQTQLEARGKKKR